MVSSPQNPRMPWLKQLSLGLTVLLLSGSCLALVGWWGDVDSLIQIEPGLPAIKVNVAAGFLVFGVALLLVELGYRWAAWLTLFPGILGIATELQNQIGINLGIDEWLALDHLQIETSSPGRMTASLAICF